MWLISICECYCFLQRSISADELSKSYHVGISRGMKEPQWVAREREQFALYRDLNKDGKLDRKEVGEWVVPVDYDSVDAEVQHIFYQADFNRVSPQNGYR